MSELSIVKGSCLCGAVKLSTTSVSHHIGGCHCNICRKWGGAAFLGVECKKGVSFEEEETISVYQSSAWAERGFCNKCGSHLFFRLKENNYYYIPVGIFDQDSDFVFDLEVFLEEKPEYYSFANKTKQMAKGGLFAIFASSSEK